MTKFLLPLLSTFLLSSSASAEDYSLYCAQASGATNTLVSAVSDMQKIVFDHEGRMIIHKTDGTQQTIDISGISRIFFSTPAVGVEQVSTDAQQTEPTAIYDLTGRRLHTTKVSDLQQGIYIINGKKTQVK